MFNLSEISPKIFVIAITLAVVIAKAATGGDTMEVENMTEVLRAYEKNLNAGDVDEIMKLYDDEGIFMPQHSQPQIGMDAVRKAYVNVFNTIKLDIVFEIDEIQQINEDWGFARTRSNGTTTILSNGAKVGEGNQEIFLLKKDASGNWKIARYIFSTTNPRQ